MAEVQTPWWRPEGNFFSDLYLEADNSFQTFFGGSDSLSNRTQLEIEGVERLGHLAAAGRVIDCPCGYGRHSVELARRGHCVTGFDINERFMGIAREAAASAAARSELAGSVEFRWGDMRELPLTDPADLLINMFYSFGFFDSEEENLRVMRSFRSCLREGGRALIHTMITVPALRDGRVPSWESRELKSGRRLVSRRSLDETTRREVGDWSVVGVDGVEEPLRRYSVRIYEPGELYEMFREAGFREVEIFGAWDASPYRDESPYLIAVGER